MKLKVLFFVLLGVCGFLISCDPAAKSASQAFDQANSVIKTGSDKLFMDPAGTPTPLPLP